MPDLCTENYFFNAWKNNPFGFDLNFSSVELKHAYIDFIQTQLLWNISLRSKEHGLLEYQLFKDSSQVGDSVHAVFFVKT